VLGDEAHIVTIASHPKLRRRRLGELMLLHLIERARETGVTAVTLEVRASNRAAQELYHKWGFEQVGLRKRYYRDNNEDALLLTLFDVGSDEIWLPMAHVLEQLPASIDLSEPPTDERSISRK
jgi:ribosomal-protein-alanine N-acetyltransferase